MSINNQYGYPRGFSYFMMQRMMNDGEFKPGLVQLQDTATGPGKNYAFVEIVADVASDPGGSLPLPAVFAEEERAKLD